MPERSARPLALAALAALAALGDASPARAALPQPAFSASRSERCVAPCAVLFDATATTAAGSAHPFHELDYRWDFGDERGATWAISGRPKNQAIGAIAGHLFEHPGRFTVTLTVATPSGGRAVATKSIAVDDPEQAFAGDRTVCVSARGDFSGCPAGARRVTSAGFDGAFANEAGRRTLLRRGERFTWERPVRLADAAGRGAALDVFGPGAQRATLAAAEGAGFQPGNDWRIARVELVGADTVKSHAPFIARRGVRRFTVADVSVRRFHFCLDFFSPDAPDAEVAFVDFACAEFPDPGNGAKLFEDTEQSMFLGLDLDKGDHVAPDDQTEFVYRASFSRTKLIQHGRFRGRAPNQSKNALQLRHCFDPARFPKCGPAGAVPSRHVIVSDNHFVEGGGPRGLMVVRVCDHGACTGKPGESWPVEDYVFERNLIQLDTRDPAAEQLPQVIQLQARRVSVRDNVADLQGLPHGGGGRVVFALVVPFSDPARDALEDVWVERNTVYLGAGHPGSVALCGSAAAGRGLVCARNLLFAPGLGGAAAATFGPGWSAPGNRIAESNPFAGAPPARRAATLRELDRFRARDGDAGARVGGAAR